MLYVGYVYQFLLILKQFLLIKSFSDPFFETQCNYLCQARRLWIWPWFCFLL